MAEYFDLKETGFISAASPEAQFKAALDHRYKIARQALNTQPTTYESLMQLMRTDNGLYDNGEGDQQMFDLVASFLPRLSTPIQRMAQNGELRQIVDDIFVALTTSA